MDPDGDNEVKLRYADGCVSHYIKVTRLLSLEEGGWYVGDVVDVDGRSGQIIGGTYAQGYMNAPFRVAFDDGSYSDNVTMSQMRRNSFTFMGLTGCEYTMTKFVTQRCMVQ